MSKEVNPYQVLYWNPSLPVIKFAKMAEKFHNKKDMEILQKLSELTGWKLASSSDLNWRQRKKWSKNKIQVGINVYYFIPPEQIKLKGKEISNAEKTLSKVRG